MSSYDLADRWERIRQLKRDGNLSEAIALLEQEAADQEAENRRQGWGVAPGAFRELQKIYRREGRPSDELAILRRLKAGTSNPDARIDALISEATLRLDAAAAGPKRVACPHCGVVLDPPPNASRKCPDCREELIVRTDTVTKDKLVLSPEGAKQFDRDKETARAKAKVMTRLGNLRLGLDDYEKAASELREQFNVEEPQSGDVFWRIASKLHIDQAMAGEWLDAARTQSQMAQHLRDEGRDPNRALEGMFTYELRYHAEATAPNSASTAIPFLDILNSCDCDVCQKDAGRRISVLDAQSQMPLPHTECETGFCRCRYGTVRSPSAYDTDGDLPAAVVHTEVVVDRSAKNRSVFKRIFGG